MINLAFRMVKEQTGSEYIATRVAMREYNKLFPPLRVSRCGCATCISRIEQENQMVTEQEKQNQI